MFIKLSQLTSRWVRQFVSSIIHKLTQLSKSDLRPFFFVNIMHLSYDNSACALNNIEYHGIVSQKLPLLNWNLIVHQRKWFQIIQIIQIQFLGVPWGVQIHFLYGFHGGYPMGCAILEGSWCRRWLQMARLRMKWSKWSITMVRCQWSMGYNGHIHGIHGINYPNGPNGPSYMFIIVWNSVSHGFSNILESYPHDYDPNQLTPGASFADSAG